MADDIVTRLRVDSDHAYDSFCEMCTSAHVIAKDAADEIERLRIALHICASDYMQDTFGVGNNSWAINKTIKECLQEADAQLMEARR